MTPERRRTLVDRIAVLYFASFLLPTAWCPGFGFYIFLMAPILGVSIGCLALLIAWSANILFAVGLVALHAGHNRRAVLFGAAGFAAALHAAPFAISVGVKKAPSAALEGFNLLGELGYIVWVLAMFALTGVGIKAAADDTPASFRIQLQIEWVMVAIAGFAVSLAMWLIVAPVLYHNWSFQDGFHLNGSVW